MPGADGQDPAVARVYALAMLELADEQGEADALLGELLDFADRAEKNAEFAAFLSSPTVDADARRGVIERVFRGKYSDLLVDSLQVISGKDRLDLIRGVAEAYRLAHEELRGRVEVHVLTAIPLTRKLRDRVKAVASGHAGKEADLVEIVDESLIGGLVLRIGDRKFDTSVATRLKTLASALLDRASRELHGGRTYL